MHPCPCCGYKTLPSRGDYGLCPVCWWEDDGDAEPWEYSGPNGRSVVEAQQEFLAQRRPYALRPGRVRRPRRTEARDPGWKPCGPLDELLIRVQQETEERERRWQQECRQVAEEIAADPEGPARAYNDGVRALRAQAPGLTHREVRSRLRDLGQEHGCLLPEAYLELQSRLLTDPAFYRRHPLRALWWLVRHGRPGTFRRRWQELRTGRFRIAG